MTKILVVEEEEPMVEGVETKEEPGPWGPRAEISLPAWCGKGQPSRMRTVWSTLFRISCWSAVAWLVWNHVLSTRLNAGGIGFFMSIAMGSFFHVMSIIFEDP